MINTNNNTMINTNNNTTTYYIVVAFNKGCAYILQYKGVISNIFYNNHIKTFKTKQTAIKNAHKICNKYKLSSVKVYQINENEYIAETIEECKSGIIIIIKGITYIVILGVLFNFISKLF